MTHGTDQQAQQPTPTHHPRTQAIQAAAQAADAHQQNPDTATLHTMQDAVQNALNLGVHPHDIRTARATAVNA